MNNSTSDIDHNKDGSSNDSFSKSFKNFAQSFHHKVWGDSKWAQSFHDKIWGNNNEANVHNEPHSIEK